MLGDVDNVIEIMTEILDRLRITYLVGGSVASGIHGVYRTTNDVDIAVDIRREDVGPLHRALSGFYVDEEMIIDAIETRSAFSIIHLEILMKVDVFIRAHDAWTDEVWTRRLYLPITADSKVHAYFPTAEDTILQKLRWFEMGRRVSDRQWSDIGGILKTQAEKLDYNYLRQWAVKLSLAELLEKAVDHAMMR